MHWWLLCQHQRLSSTTWYLVQLGMPVHKQLKLSLDQSNLPLQQYDGFLIFGTLDMPEHV